MSSSQAVLTALSDIVQTPLNFVCLVEQSGSEYFMALARHSFFMLDDSLKSIRAEVFYAHIDKVVVDALKPNLIQLNLLENRPPNVPSKLDLMTADKQMLLDSLKSSWKTDLMYRKGVVGDFPLLKGKIVKKIRADPFMLKKKIPQIVTTEPENFRKKELKGYAFFLPGSYANTEEEGLFYDASRRERMFVQVSDTIPLDFMPYFKEKEDLRFYCEEYAHALMVDETYWVITSNIYIKRSNLNADRASWSGWEVHIRTNKQDILVILLRRKYIPPIMDSFADIFFIIYGKEKTKADIEKLSAEASSKFPDTEETLKRLRDAADSMHSTTTINKIYTMIVQEKANALLLDEEAFAFYQYKLGIRPKGLIFALCFMHLIFKFLTRFDKAYDQLSRNLNLRYSREMSNPEDKKVIQDLLSKSQPSEVADKYNSSGINAKSSDDAVGRNWRFKISKYIAYCVDGGLLSGQFTIVDILKVLPSLEGDTNTKEIMMKVLDYLLYLTPEREDHQYERLNVKAQRMVTKGGYIYNSKVMRILLEQGYIERELLTQDQPQLFPNFLIHLIKTSSNLHLRSSICRQIIKSQAEVKKNNAVTDIIKNAFKQMVGPMIELYKSPNRHLAELAAVALVNLASGGASKDTKQVIMQEGGAKIAVLYVECKHEGLMHFTLHLISYLCTISTNIDVFMSYDLLDKLVMVLHGTNVVGTMYSEKVFGLCFQLLRQISGSSEENKNKVGKELGLMIEVILKRPDFTEQTHIEIVSLMSLLSVKHAEHTKILIKQLLLFYLEKLAKKELKVPELIDKALYFVLILAQTNEESIVVIKRVSNIVSSLNDYGTSGDMKIRKKVDNLLERLDVKI